MAGGQRRSGPRDPQKRSKSAAKRRPSSRRWLERQLKDPYVAAARSEGYRSRAAFKLAQLDDRFHFLAPGRKVVDLGASPGGWSQVAAERVKAGRPGGGRVVAIDLQAIDPAPGVTAIEGDAFDPQTPALLRDALSGAADVVLSDMATPTTGHAPTDHLRVVALCEAALDVAKAVLAPGGAFVCKVLGSGADAGLLASVRREFARVKHAKPPASRAGSAEIYLVAAGFRGADDDTGGAPADPS